MASRWQVDMQERVEKVEARANFVSGSTRLTADSTSSQNA
jgi:hypothetical protein